MIIPRIRTNSGSTSNGMLSVQIVNDLGNQQSWLGVLAQEVFEVRWKWANLWGTLFGGDKFRQDMEIRSHAVEAVVAATFDGRDPEEYMALMLTMLDADKPYSYRNTYGYFKGMSTEDLRAALKSRTAEAIQWVNDHGTFFREWYARRPK